ncbi:MAG: hypothetical protein MJ237_05665 [bacterium]|nr:hypothetical protein [bacterium]
MAVTFNEAMNDATAARQLWLNYTNGGNTFGVTEDQINQLESHWGSTYVQKWQQYSDSSDSTRYVIDDTSYTYSNSYDLGQENAVETTGYANSAEDKATRKTRTTVDGILGGVGGAAGAVVASQTAGKVVGKAAGEAAKESGKGAAGKVCAYIAAVCAVAEVASYLIRKPNKEETEACEKAQEGIAEYAEATTEAQGEMVAAADEAECLREEAEFVTEEANNTFGDQAADYGIYQASFEDLQAKAESGELKSDEVDLYNSLREEMVTLGDDMSTVKGEATDVVGDIQSDIDAQLDFFDAGAEIAAETEGFTEAVAGYDDATKTNCTVEQFSQTATSISGTAAGIKLMAGGWWNIAIGIASMAAGVTAGFNAKEQGTFKGIADTTIKSREATQELNDATFETYDTGIESYTENVDAVVNDCILEVPEVEIPEEDGNIEVEEVPEETDI